MVLLLGRTRVAAVVALLAAVTLSLAVPNAPAAAAPAGRGESLPNDFLWGVAASGFQTEGSSPDSNWIRYERAGRTEDHIGTSVDFRHRYRSDIALAKGLGVGVYRIGIEWARIEPRPGVIDQRELAYYDDVLRAVVAAGMRPMITLDHWVYPGWIAADGGWADPRTPGRWLRHQRMIVDRYAHYHPLWITVNEPTAYVLKEVTHGGLAPADVPVMFERLVAVHRAIYDHIHLRDPHAQVSSNVAYIPTAEPQLDAMFLNRVRDKLDYVGLDYYYSVSPSNVGAANVALDRLWDAPISADGLYYALRDMSARFPRMPLYVVEAGMPTHNGAARPDRYRRADHLRDLVYWVQRARGDGIEVMGMNYWSLTDNYEWGSYAPRFGLYTVNVQTDPTLQRRPTDAVAAYRAITRANGVGAHYRPSRPPEVCSLVAAPRSCTEPVS